MCDQYLMCWDHEIIMRYTVFYDWEEYKTPPENDARCAEAGGGKIGLKLERRTLSETCTL